MTLPKLADVQEDRHADWEDQAVQPANEHEQGSRRRADRQVRGERDDDKRDGCQLQWKTRLQAGRKLSRKLEAFRNKDEDA